MGYAPKSPKMHMYGKIKKLFTPRYNLAIFREDGSVLFVRSTGVLESIFKNHFNELKKKSTSLRPGGLETGVQASD